MQEFHTNSELLTRDEVMELLKIGRSTFYKLIREGKLNGFMDGNRYKVPVQSIEKYINSKMEE